MADHTDPPLPPGAAAPEAGPCKRLADAPDVPSPCVRLCTLDEQDTCLGCGRTLTEITGWTKMSLAQKADCVARGRDRLARLGRPLPTRPAAR